MQTTASWLMMSDSEAKKLKMSEPAAAASGEEKTPRGSEQPQTPPKSSGSRPPTALQVQQEMAAAAFAEKPDGDFALDDLKTIVTSLGALDACLMHFSSKISSKASTPESTLEPDAVQNAAGAVEPEAADLAMNAAGEEVDWGDEEEPKTDEVSWDKLTDSVGQLQGSSAEEIQRLSELLASHRNQLQKVVEHQEAKDKDASAAGEVLDLLMAQNWDKALEAISGLRPEQLEHIQDYSGMTVLRHAVRSHKLELVMKIVETCPPLANRCTSPHRQPGHWTPLMILSNMPAPPPGSHEAEAHSHIGYLLCQHMSLDGLNVRGTTWATATHIAVSRSKWSLVKSILYRIDDLGGRPAVMNHTKLTNNNATQFHIMHCCCF